MKNLIKADLTSFLSVHYPNAGRNLQHNRPRRNPFKPQIGHSKLIIKSIFDPHRFQDTNSHHKKVKLIFVGVGNPVKVQANIKQI